MRAATNVCRDCGRRRGLGFASRCARPRDYQPGTGWEEVAADCYRLALNRERDAHAKTIEALRWALQYGTFAINNYVRADALAHARAVLATADHAS